LCINFIIEILRRNLPGFDGDDFICYIVLLFY